ncbi:MAG: 50S ribosomal protein L32 [Parcubacteria group bacterium]|nr:50S ribosomal protein L32 [Parcubacteria group bacterium]
MSVPPKRHSSSKVKRRRSHQALKTKQLHPCPECKKPIPSHQVCPFCHMYKGSKF